MDDESVDHEFFNMYVNNYTQAIDDFIEFTRLQHVKIQQAIAEDKPEIVTELASEMFLASGRIQVGNIQNLISGYANALFRERAAAVELHDLSEWVLAELKKLHEHLVYVNQPLEELMMVTDLMVAVRDRLDESVISQTLKGAQS